MCYVHRVRKFTLDVGRRNVPSVTNGEIEAIKAEFLERRSHLGDRQILEALGEGDEFHGRYLDESAPQPIRCLKCVRNASEARDDQKAQRRRTPTFLVFRKRCIRTIPKKRRIVGAPQAGGSALVPSLRSHSP